MKTVFKKQHLPFLKNVLHRGNGRDFWTLARTMQDENGLQHQLPAEILLLQRGAQTGDVWSMCELARTYFYHCGDTFLPMALHYWKKAVLQNDGGAKHDLENLPIHDRILNYTSFDKNPYKEIEIKCALLTEWHLTKYGISPWESIHAQEKKSRIRALVKESCHILQIPEVELQFVPGLCFQGSIVDGLAYWENKIDIREELLFDFERLIEVIFHELGHIITFEIRKNTHKSNLLKQLYGISEGRILSWERNEQGYEVTTSEEDPDTLSYGVYTVWAAFFCTL